jgi:predicted metal-dependent hydrolase
MINNFISDNSSLIKKYYEEAFRVFDPKRETPEIEVRFYPYVGINHTIRLRDGKIYVRLAEICKHAPLETQRALAFILVAKLLRKKVPTLAAEIYRSFVKSHETQAKAVENKRQKGRKIITTAEGDVYDLEEIFAQLNKNYFQNSIEKPTLSWSARKTYRILGHHDAAHKTIIISKSLDDAKVPRYVVEYVVFHEMLHVFHPTQHRDGRRYNHTPQFRRDEKKFVYFKEAESWIEQNARRLKQNAKKYKKMRID